MKILTISNYFPNHPGGIEFVALNLTSRWRKRHHVRWVACDVSTPRYENSKDDIPLTAWNITETRFGFPYPIPTISSITTITKLVKWSDIVHLHDCLYLANIIAFIASLIYSKPIVITQHVGLVTYREKAKMALQLLAYRLIGFPILKRSSLVIFVNPRVQEWFEKSIKIRRSSLLPNGVDAQIFRPPVDGERETARAKLGLSTNEMLFLFIGRFTQKKGIQLIKEIAISRPKHRWIMIGNGDINVREWNLPNVSVLSPQSQIQLREFYIAADIFILPSTGEGFPLAVQEALSCGLPSAVSEETAESMPNAPLIPLNVSSLPQMLQTLDELAESANARKRLQVASRDFAKQWDWEVTARKYEELFINVLDAAKAKLTDHD